MASLIVTGGPLAGQKYALGETSILGRSFDADVRIDDLTVSRHHAKFTRTASGYVVVDLGSGNGTAVNGERIYSPKLLRAGDEVEISQHKFEFSEAEEKGSDFDTTLTLSETDDHGTDSTIAATIDLETTTRMERRLAANPKALLRAHHRLKTILGLSNTIQGELDLTRVLEEIMNGLFRIFPQADRGFLLLVDPTGKTLVADAMSDQRFSRAQSVVNFRIRSVMCVPLVAQNQLVGLLHVDTLDPTSAFQRDDLETLTGIANQAAVAIANATMHERLMRQQKLERDMQLAQQVQLSFLPDKTPDVPGMKFCVSYRTALQVGGDFYDFVTQPDGKIVVAIGDVSGKGVPAALLMAKMTSDVRLCSMSHSEPKDIVAEINRRTVESSSDETFVTFVLMTLDPDTGRLTLTNAGHMPPLLREASEGRVRAVEGGIGFPLGVMEDVEYDQIEIVLKPGDTLTTFTDGVTEAMNAEHEAYGEERLVKVIGEGASDPSELLERVLTDVQQYVGDQPQSDDLTFLCFGKE